MQVRKKFQCRNDEVMPMAKKVLKAYNKDIEDFAKHDTRFGQKQLQKMQELLEETKKEADISQCQKEQEMISHEIYSTMHDIRGFLWEVEEALKVEDEEKREFYGISNCRKALRRRKIDIVIQAVESLINNINAKIENLTQAGFEKEKLDALTQKLIWLKDTKAAQGIMKTQLSEAKNKKLIALNELWKEVNAILDTGKKIYTETNPKRAKKYSAKRIIKKIRENED